MPIDYFAHAVYGVAPDDADQDLIAGVYLDVLGDELDKVDEVAEDEEFFGRVAAGLRRTGLWSGLCKKYALPHDARLLRVDPDDGHPGNSQTPPETWLFGWGLLDFPRIVVPGSFGDMGAWHTWVTCNG